MQGQNIGRLIGMVVLWHVTTSLNALGQSYEYAYFELQPLSQESTDCWIQKLNSHGDTVGASELDSTVFHAVKWSAYGQVSDLGVIDGYFSGASDINSAGHAVGWSNYQPGQNRYEEHAALWKDGAVIDLGTLGGFKSEARAINDVGQICGHSESADGNFYAFLWEAGVMRLLPGIDYEKISNCYDINEGGQVVGKVTVGLTATGALWQSDGTLTVLPHLETGPTTAHAINEQGQIVGQTDVYYDKVHACGWFDGHVFDLHTNGIGKNSSAWGINNVNQVVGWAGTPPLNQHAFVWDRKQGMRLLEDLVPPQLRHTRVLFISYDINDAGQIPVYAHSQSLQWDDYAILLSPIHPSFELSGIQPGIGGQVNTITASNLSPGTKVYFCWSRHGGGTVIPGCEIQTNALQLDSPKVAGAAVADADGIAVLQGKIPSRVNGETLLFQAVVPGECAISNLVVQRFE